MLADLINAALTRRPLNERLYSTFSEIEWKQCYDIALKQNVLAMIFPVMSSLPKESRPSFELWSQWMAYTQGVDVQSRYKREVVRKIGAWLSEDGLSTMLLKGFSLSVLYPEPNLREFSDIDIFSGEDYDAVNTCLAKHGVHVKGVDGHHAYFTMDDVSVEHHYAFHNTKVKHGLEGPEGALQQLAATNKQVTTMPGINIPCGVFTALFVAWHAYEHFIHEKIQLRHVIDWAFALRQLSNDEAKVLSNEKKQYSWGFFANTMTAIALHQLNLPYDWFTEAEQCAADEVVPNLEQKVLDDIINSPSTAMGLNATHRRVNIAKRLLKNRWKLDSFSDIDAKKLLWRELVGHLKK